MVASPRNKKGTSFMPPQAALLISRQPMQPCGNTPWVKSCIEAISWIKSRGYTLLGSCGLLTWELALTAAINAGIPVRIVVPVYGKMNRQNVEKDVRQHFSCISGASITIECVYHPMKRQSMRVRDQEVIDAADLLVPISIRPGGFFESRLAEVEPNRIEKRFCLQYRKRKEPLAYSLAEEAVDEETLRQSDSYLIHWTRTSHTPWPTESASDFCRAIIQSHSYPRTAFDTLCNILETGSIKSGQKHMPQKQSCVCFSGANLSSFIPLMRWRQRYRHMAFEPYGIGIRKEYASECSILPVVYRKPDQKKVSSVESWLVQSAGSRGDWQLEQEYRHLGDLLLSQIPPEAIACFCRIGSEALVLTARYSLKALPLWQR